MENQYRIIETVDGPMPEEKLVRRERMEEDMLIVEYFLHERLVHRSVGVFLTGTSATATSKS